MAYCELDNSPPGRNQASNVPVKRLPDALRNAATNLAVHDRVVDHATDRVDRREPDHRHPAGLGVDLDLADLAAVRRRLDLEIAQVLVLELERSAQLVRQVRARLRALHHLEQIERPAVLDRDEAAAEKTYLRLIAGAERVRGDSRAAQDRRIHVAAQHRSRHQRRARCVGARAFLDELRIAVADRHA